MAKLTEEVVNRIHGLKKSDPDLTCTQIAHRVNVSLSTVSNVLQGKAKATINREGRMINYKSGSTIRKRTLAAARNQYAREGEIEIDDDAVISKGGNGRGVYVQAWVWVYAEDIEKLN